jgi:hypothetical protein
MSVFAKQTQFSSSASSRAQTPHLLPAMNRSGFEVGHTDYCRCSRKHIRKLVRGHDLSSKSDFAKQTQFMVSNLVLSEVEGVEPSNPITVHRSPFTNSYALAVGAGVNRGDFGGKTGENGGNRGSFGNYRGEKSMFSPDTCGRGHYRVTSNESQVTEYSIQPI